MSGMAVSPRHAPASGVTSRLKRRSTATAGDDDLRHRLRSLRTPVASSRRYAVDQVADAIRHRAGRHFGKICVALAQDPFRLGHPPHPAPGKARLRLANTTQTYPQLGEREG